MVKLRLSRQGRIRKAHYRIVAADARAPRDGRFIEKLGTFDPHTNPGTVHMQVERVLDWLSKGAQPTPRVRSLCSAGGLMLGAHLMLGIRRGKTDKKTVKKRFAAWEKAVSLRKKPKITFVGSTSMRALIEALPATAVAQQKMPKQAKKAGETTSTSQN